MNNHDGTASAEFRVKSGIRGLDTILDGGFIVGGIYIVQGPPGAGKTILTNQLCFNHVAAGGLATFVTLLAENHGRMLNNMRRLAFFDETVVPDRLVYLSAFAEMRDGGMGALLNLLRREIQQRRTSVMVIDGLVSAHTVARTDNEFKQFVHDLQEIALATDCTMFLTTNDTRDVSPERTMVDGLVALSETIHGWQAVSDLQVLKFRGGSFLRGRHSYLIDATGVVVYPRIESLYAYPSRAGQADEGRTTTGVDGLDAILGGGLPDGSTTLLVGPPGVGKTTTGLQFLARCTAAEPGLFFGFYETPMRLRVRAQTLDPALGDLFDRGIVEMQWQTPAGDLIDAYGQRLLDDVRRRGVKRLFIDGLSALQSGMTDSSRTSAFFSALSNELRVRGVTTIYSLEVPNLLGPLIRMPIENASSLAENILIMRFFESGARLHRLLSVLKVRNSDFDASAFEFTIGRDGIRIDGDAQHVDRLLGRPAGAVDPHGQGVR